MKKKVVWKVDMHDARDRKRALKIVSGLPGIESVGVDMKDGKVTCVGDIDPVQVTRKLKKKFQTNLITVGPAKVPEKKKEESKKDEDERLALIPAHVKASPYNYIPTMYPVNGIRDRNFLNKFFHHFSPSTSAAMTNTNLQIQAPLSLHHRAVTSFQKSLAKIHTGKRAYCMEILKTLSKTSGIQLFQHEVRNRAITARLAQLASTSIAQPQHNLDGASSGCISHNYTLLKTEAMLAEEKGVVFTGKHSPHKSFMESFSFS